ncbi:MAG: hypothetical protein JJ975_11370 [Bacteroidia bacterium]|nr:hypothetical protein [Bacteroidia bacterium]
MKKYVFKWILLSVALIGIVALFFVFNNKKNKEVVNDVTVNVINSHSPFVSKEMIVQHLRNDSIVFLGIAAERIDLSQMETSVENNPYVEYADCYFSLNGGLTIDISQRTPILRVQPEGTTGYYIDRTGVQFPLSPMYTPNVKIATGHIQNDLNKKLYTFTSYVNQSTFWKPFIEQIFVRPNGDIVFTTQIGGHEVNIGDNERLPQKLDKLEKFYKRASSNLGWEVYREINLKFKDQVICSK